MFKIPTNKKFVINVLVALLFGLYFVQRRAAMETIQAQISSITPMNSTCHGFINLSNLTRCTRIHAMVVYREKGMVQSGDVVISELRGYNRIEPIKGVPRVGDWIKVHRDQKSHSLETDISQPEEAYWWIGAVIIFLILLIVRFRSKILQDSPSDVKIFYSKLPTSLRGFETEMERHLPLWTYLQVIATLGIMFTFHKLYMQIVLNPSPSEPINGSSWESVLGLQFTWPLIVFAATNRNWNLVRSMAISVGAWLFIYFYSVVFHASDFRKIHVSSEQCLIVAISTFPIVLIFLFPSHLIGKVIGMVGQIPERLTK